MGTATFNRHVRRYVDAAVHRVFDQLRHRPHLRDTFARLLVAVHERSDLMKLPRRRDGRLIQIDAVLGLSHFERAWLDVPEAWQGARGHPLAVVDDLARHLVGRYPTPRFLAGAWLAPLTVDGLVRRRWFVSHARGRRFRELRLPLAMTRRMERHFLASPDHLEIDPALRRAEVLGLGGSPELADAILATRVGRSFDDADHWRAALTWMARVEDDLDLRRVGELVDYLHAMRGGADLFAGRTAASMMRRCDAWHADRGRHRGRFPRQRLSWSRSPWRERVEVVEVLDRDGEPRPIEWRMVELLDNHQLVEEGRSMRHCVATYAPECLRGRVAIWSLRRSAGPDTPLRSVLTVEIERQSSTIIQVKGPCNRWASGEPLARLRAWAAGEQVRFSRAVEDEVD